jgi:hypothetical protein
MFLIEILLPLRDASGNPFPPEAYESLAQLLTARFGGITSFSRSPAEGRWRNEGATEHDDIAVLEVMTDSVDRAWWSKLRQDLMREFSQEDIVVRSHGVELLA